MNYTENQWDGARIRALRMRLGITQQQLADMMSVDKVSVSRWENDRKRPRAICERMLDTVANQRKEQGI